MRCPSEKGWGRQRATNNKGCWEEGRSTLCRELGGEGEGWLEQKERRSQQMGSYFSCCLRSLTGSIVIN